MKYMNTADTMFTKQFKRKTLILKTSFSHCSFFNIERSNFPPYLNRLVRLVNNTYHLGNSCIMTPTFSQKILSKVLFLHMQFRNGINLITSLPKPVNPHYKKVLYRSLSHLHLIYTRF